MSSFSRNTLKNGFIYSLLSTAILAGNAHAAGFGIIEQSVTGLGNAFSGGSSSATDGSTIYFNPAGMSFLKDKSGVTLGAHIIDPNAKFKDKGSYYIPGGPGVPLDVNNEDGGDAGPIALVPNFYYTREINSQWMFGVGMNAPFGLVTDYDKGWVGRYHALKSDLKTINLNPSLSFKASPTLSLGFGVNAQYIDASLSNAVDFGTFAGLFQAVDGKATVEGDDWSFGYNLGLMWQANPATRIGLAYRSRIKHNLEGDVDFERPSSGIPAADAVIAGTAAALGLVNGDAGADITLPDSLSVGFHHQVNNKLAITGDVTWTNWSVLDELRIEFDNPAAADSVTTTKWEDSNRYSLGMSYAYNNQWTWRAGVAFDESTTSDSAHLTPRVPDADRTWLTLGFTYKPTNSNMSLDFGYAHLFVDDADINKSPAEAENLLRGALIGEYELDVNILSAQARWAF